MIGSSTGAPTIHIVWQTVVRRDKHHVIHNRQEWNLRPEGMAIREHHTMLFEGPRSIHDELHANVPAVPLLGIHALQRTVSLWRPDETDQMKSVENLQRAIERAVHHPRSHAIETQLGYLAVHAIDLQKPYLREMLGSPRLHIV